MTKHILSVLRKEARLLRAQIIRASESETCEADLAQIAFELDEIKIAIKRMEVTSVKLVDGCRSRKFENLLREVLDQLAIHDDANVSLWAGADIVGCGANYIDFECPVSGACFTVWW